MNGKGKISHKNGKYLFESEYAQDMKIKGKEYINGKLVYEGEYIYDNFHDRKYNGKGYDENGCLIYELINGNGKVIEYQGGGIVYFEGEYKNGRKNGKGKLYHFHGKLEYEGEFIEGKEKISK
jgi:antitoxin component YwqK of YwqJK toxin-antitoxin module